MKKIKAESLVALHTHTHIYSLIKKRGVKYETSLQTK